jgi:hypothetical protein
MRLTSILLIPGHVRAESCLALWCNVWYEPRPEAPCVLLVRHSRMKGTTESRQLSGVLCVQKLHDMPGGTRI